MPDQRGFTLIEVLIALAITALVAMLSFTSISTVLNSVDSLRSRGDRISELNRAWNLVNRDISQMVNRPIRNEFGEVESTLFGGEVVDSSLTFTRGGWHNPNRQLRSELQRVTYRLEGDVLWRENFVVLDRTRESEPQRARLLRVCRASKSPSSTPASSCRTRILIRMTGRTTGASMHPTRNRSRRQRHLS